MSLSVLKKNKKKNKKQKEEEEQVEEAAPVEEEAEEEEELVVKSNKKASQSESTTVSVDEEKVNKAVKSIEEVSEDLIEQFRTVAQKVLKKTKDDPAAPLAAALVVLTGANKVVTKSILTQREVSLRSLRHSSSNKCGHLSFSSTLQGLHYIPAYQER